MDPQETTPVIFHCRTCGAALTSPLVLLRDQNQFRTEDGEDYIPQGTYSLSDGEYFTQSKGRYLVNIKDAKNTRNHSDHRRLNGCCGLDGLDGRNKVCINGHEVGTEHSDCWMPHAIDLEPDLVSVGN